MADPASPALLLSIEIAAERLGVRPAMVRSYIHQRLLRSVSEQPPRVWASDVERLSRVLTRRTEHEYCMGA
jgi:hypothetical protein